MIVKLYILFLICWGISVFLAIKKNSTIWLFSMWDFWLALIITNLFILKEAMI